MNDDDYDYKSALLAMKSGLINPTPRDYEEILSILNTKLDEFEPVHQAVPKTAKVLYPKRKIITKNSDPKVAFGNNRARKI